MCLGDTNLAALVFRDNVAMRSGGAMTIQESTGVAVLHGLLIENNRAYVGGGMHIASVVAFYVVSDDLRPTIFRNNTAVTGGGLYFRAGLYPLLLLQVKCTIRICPY